MSTAGARSAWSALAATVVLEVSATLCLRWSDGFRLVVPSVLAVLGYGATVVFLARALRVIPMSLAYVVWTGLGTVGVAVAGWVIFGERLPASAWVGVFLVAGGVALINIRGGGDGGRRGASG